MTYILKITLKSDGFLGASYSVLPLLFHSSVFPLIFLMISKRIILDGKCFYTTMKLSVFELLSKLRYWCCGTDHLIIKKSSRWDLLQATGRSLTLTVPCPHGSPQHLLEGQHNRKQAIQEVSGVHQWCPDIERGFARSYAPVHAGDQLDGKLWASILDYTISRDVFQLQAFSVSVNSLYLNAQWAGFNHSALGTYFATSFSALHVKVKVLPPINGKRLVSPVAIFIWPSVRDI